MRERSRERGFTFVEALVVAGIIGLIALIAGVQISNFANKANLEGAAADVRALLEAAKSSMVNQNTAVTVRYLQLNGRPALQLATPAGAALRTLVLPDYVAFAFNAAATAPTAWPAPTAGDLFTCDSQGRTLSASGTQVGAIQVVSLTHKGMVDAVGYAEVRPRLRYDVQVYPLWTVGVAKRTF